MLLSWLAFIIIKWAGLIIEGCAHTEEAKFVTVIHLVQFHSFSCRGNILKLLLFFFFFFKLVTDNSILVSHIYYIVLGKVCFSSRTVHHCVVLLMNSMAVDYTLKKS